METARPQTPQRVARVLIVEDHPVVRNCFAELIASQPDMAVCGEAGDADEAIQSLRDERVDVALVDLSLRSSSGLELCKRVKGRFPQVKMLVVSAHDETVFARRVLHAGASGYVSKEATTEEILAAVRTVIDGRVYLSDQVKAQLLRRAAGTAETTGNGAPNVSELTDRELEVLELMGWGMTSRQIAARMHLSPKTVESYRDSLKRKLPVRNTAELTRFAVQWVLEGR